MDVFLSTLHLLISHQLKLHFSILSFLQRILQIFYFLIFLFLLLLLLILFLLIMFLMIPLLQNLFLMTYLLLILLIFSLILILLLFNTPQELGIHLNICSSITAILLLLYPFLFLRILFLVTQVISFLFCIL
jgi:hypothetical protein